MKKNLIYGNTNDTCKTDANQGCSQSVEKTITEKFSRAIESRQRRFVRYREGAELYSMSVYKFQELAKAAGATYKLDKIVLVNCDIFEAYLEQFRVLNKKSR